MILDHQLAQQIVDRTMSIIGYNINVMNHAGIIIGSGESQRLGQVHDGAILALKHGDSIELTEESCRSLKGVKPGINMLLQSNEQVVGILGITGEPNDIREFANLVKMTAEMIIDQADLVEKLQWDRRHREEFITAWVNNELSVQELESWAGKLSIDIMQPRVAVVIQFRDQETPKSLQSIRKLVDLLEYPQRDNLVAIISMNEIVVLKPCQSVAQWDSQIESQRIDKLLARLGENQIDGFDIALGQLFESPWQIHRSYQSAKQVLQTGRAHQPKRNKHLFEELRLPVLLSPLADFWQGEQLMNAMDKLERKDKSGQLVKTLDALFKANGSVSECSKLLFVHRNTLRYRLDKISEITGISTSDFVGLTELYIARQISKVR
ncbi:sugar diacid recognition domain-containing protein [Vibrio sonorensis]|uniref:sugar diacid recognition domain-containing protein n=1 Tax=Vibrio sonorensis TaxID=1004316 RepID=UPI0008DAF912|nr:sugar diacid recognition domain-containing protein [Vibrio sonorensis]